MPEHDRLNGAPRRPSILLVEDDEVVGTFLVGLLATEGEVHWATTGEQARDIVGGRDWDLIVSDIDLPGMSGLDLLRVLRKRPDTGKSCAIIVTSYAMDTDKENAFAAGCDGYITKPIDIRAFPELITRALAGEAVSH